MNHRTNRGESKEILLIGLALGVVAVVAFLAIAICISVPGRGRIPRAETELAALSAALESYKTDHGDYPHFTNAGPGTGTNGDNSLLRSYLSPGTGKIYFEFPHSMGPAPGPIKDPYGENYGYQYPGDPTRSGTNFFDLYSRVGSSDTNKWSRNW